MSQSGQTPLNETEWVSIKAAEIEKLIEAIDTHTFTLQTLSKPWRDRIDKARNAPENTGLEPEYPDKWLTTQRELEYEVAKELDAHNWELVDYELDHLRWRLSQLLQWQYLDPADLQARVKRGSSEEDATADDGSEETMPAPPKPGTTRPERRPSPRSALEELREHGWDAPESLFQSRPGASITKSRRSSDSEETVKPGESAIGAEAPQLEAQQASQTLPEESRSTPRSSGRPAAVEQYLVDLMELEQRAQRAAAQAKGKRSEEAIDEGLLMDNE